MLEFAGRAVALAAALSVAGGPALADHKRKGHRAPPPPHHAAPPAAHIRPDGPPHARPGECYARLNAPKHVQQHTEKVLVEPGRTERREIPPRYAKQTREVVVRPEERRVEHVPPVWDTVPEKVLVRPGGERRYVEPAETRVVHETVPVEEPRLVWKLVHSRLHPTPVWCLVEEPGRVATVARTVVVKPEVERVVVTPAEYATVERKVMRRPASTREVVIPAEVKTVTVDELVEPGRIEEHVVEPKYAVVTKKRVTGEAGGGWVRVLCEEQASPHKIKAVQGALARGGYYRGPIDGKYGPATGEAVRRFQADHHLPHQGYLSWPTLERLGVEGGARRPMADAGPGAPTPLGPPRSVGRY